MSLQDDLQTIDDIIKTTTDDTAEKNAHRVIELSSRVLDDNPRVTAAHYQRSWAFRELGQYEKALEDLNVVVSRNDMPTIRFLRAETYLNLRRYEEAVADMTFIFEHMEIKEDDLINYAIFYATTFHCNGQHTDTIRILVNLDEDHKLSHFFMGVSYLALGRFETSEQYLTRSIDLDPSQKHVHSQRGIARYHLQKFDEAKVDFHIALGGNPGDAESYVYLGEVYRVQGKTKKALDAYKEAKSIIGQKEDPEKEYLLNAIRADRGLAHLSGDTAAYTHEQALVNDGKISQDDIDNHFSMFPMQLL